jgi:hypothetical protein
MGSVTTVYLLRTVADKLPFGGYTYGSLSIAKEKAGWYPGTEVVAVDVASLPAVPEPDTTLDEVLLAFRAGEEITVRGKPHVEEGSESVECRGIVRGIQRDVCDTGDEWVIVRVGVKNHAFKYVYLPVIGGGT